MPAFCAVASYGLELRTRTKKRAETHWKYLSHFFVDQSPRFNLLCICVVHELGCVGVFLRFGGLRVFIIADTLAVAGA